ncbi:MAG: hypothetical protein ACXU85_00985 [Xanthobacteraceae bacterium]
MPLITNTELQALGDKLARFAAMSVGDANFDNSFTAGLDAASAAVLSGSNSLAQSILATSDEAVIADLLPAARDLDETHPVMPTGFLLGIPGISAMIRAIDNHLKRYAGAASLDAYLSNLNAAGPTLRFHAAFVDHLKTLSAKNVFIGADLDLARVNVTGATAGTYTHLAAIDKTKYSGAKLVAKNVGALTGATNLSITGKKFDGTTATLTAAITTMTDGAETNLSDVTKVFVDVTAITVSSGGTAGNVIKIVAKTDRDISAA